MTRAADTIVLAQVVLPPSEEFCVTGLCAQKACCSIEVRVSGADRVDGDEDEAYVLPQCAAHALHTLHGVFEYATSLYPPDEPEDVPWEEPSDE